MQNVNDLYRAWRKQYRSDAQAAFAAFQAYHEQQSMKVDIPPGVEVVHTPTQDKMSTKVQANFGLSTATVYKFNPSVIPAEVSERTVYRLIEAVNEVAGVGSDELSQLDAIITAGQVKSADPEFIALLKEWKEQLGVNQTAGRIRKANEQKPTEH